MKQLLLLALALSTLVTQAQIITFPDNTFRIALISNNCVDTNSDGTPDATADLNDDNQIDVSEALQVTDLYILGQYAVTSFVGIENFTNLEVFYAEYKNVPVLDLSALVNLRRASIAHNHINTLNLGTISALEQLDCSDNNLTTIDLTHLSNLVSLGVGTNNLTSINLSTVPNLISLGCYVNPLGTIDLSPLPLLESLTCFEAELTELNVLGSPNLKFLDCKDNQLTSLPLTGLSQLENIQARSNELSSIDLTGLTSLKTLDVDSNLLTSVDISMLPNLTLASMMYNYEFSEFVSGNQPLFETLYINGGTLTQLDLSLLTGLKNIVCNSLDLTSLDVSNQPLLQSLQFSANNVTSIDISNNPLLTTLGCSNNNLQSMFLKNGSVFSTTNQYALFFDNNPTLEYICIDDNELTTIQTKLFNYGYTNVVVNSYCSFTPGGSFYTINGVAHIDSNSNGCDAEDPVFPSINLKINNTQANGLLVSNDSGNYTINVQAGAHTIIPQLENPDYFTVTPPSVTVTFPAAESPFMQDFCLVPNGIHNDLEVFIEPLNRARPGFDSFYKIVYKNKGNTVLSGTVNLDYADDYMDLVSAEPSFDTQATGGLDWNFTNLVPYESREITVRFNMNTPIEENYPLLGGDMLAFQTYFDVVSDEETPSDNTFELNQQVVNAFDPNDKACLEGPSITPDKVGQYVHYMIRFENTGSAEAENIVVKDIIDTAKFDMASFVPLSGSHPFITRITAVNNVEFIFEGVNLPFDDANNDGYVTFKIKTKPTLALGDTFSNSASIFFDYNAPIVTNNYVTTVSNVLNNHSAMQKNIAVFPNPTNDRVNFSSLDPINKIEVYDCSGRKLRTAASDDVDQIAIGDLPNGIYLIKTYTAGGSDIHKVVKR